MSLNGAARAAADVAAAVVEPGLVVPRASGEIQQKTPWQPAHRQVELDKQGKGGSGDKRRKKNVLPGKQYAT